MTERWVIAVKAHFGPTAYLADGDRLVWADDERHEAVTFSTEDKLHTTLIEGDEWMPVSALDTLRRGERTS